MSNKEQTASQEKFKTMIGGQALIEGILMRGPEKDAIVVRTANGLDVQVNPRKVHPKGSVYTWPLIRGVVGFFDSQVVGIKALLHSADLVPEEYQEEPSKLDKWLEKKLSNEMFQKVIVGIAMVLGLGLSILLFFLLPAIISGFLYNWVESTLVVHLLEGVVRMAIFMVYMILISRMGEMKRVFSYHGAEHKTIRCYEAGLPLTVENVKKQTRLHPRCGTSFLLVVMVISILVFSIATSCLEMIFPALKEMKTTVGYRFLMIAFKLMLLPLVVGITYEINRWAGKTDNTFTHILTAPGMWMQNFTTNEPDDSMIEVGIRAVNAVLPAQEGSDRWE